MGELTSLIAAFAESVTSEQNDIYNEMSLQHELGIFLRSKLPNYKIQFERNVSFFFGGKASFTKKEIDISVFSREKSELKYAIELKYPRNGQHPEQMFGFCKDVAFAEELNTAGFSAACLVVFADDHLFYKGPADGIYAYFRGCEPIHGLIRKPTGTKDAEVVVRGSYPVRWQSISGSLMYAVVEVGDLIRDQVKPDAKAVRTLARAQSEG